MSTWWLLLLLSAVLIGASSHVCKNLAEEWTKYSFDSVEVNVYDTVEWSGPGTSGNEKLISTCNKNRCSNHEVQLYNAAKVSERTGAYVLNYVISNVSRANPNMETTWKWVIKAENGAAKNFSTCNLQIYAKAKVKCQPFYFVNNNRRVAMACDVTTYPHANCNFMEHNEQINRTLQSTEIFQGQEMTVGSPVYYRRNCSMTVDITKPGTFFYRMVIDTNIPPDVVKRSDGEWKSINISIPTLPPMITQELSDTPIESKTNVTLADEQLASFVCQVKGGNPEVSNVTLVCGQHRDTSIGSSATLRLSVTRDLNGSTCQCSGLHATGSYHKTTEFTLNVLFKSDIGEESAPASNLQAAYYASAGIGLLLIAIIIGLVAARRSGWLPKTWKRAMQRDAFHYQNTENHVDVESCIYGMQMNPDVVNVENTVYGMQKNQGIVDVKNEIYGKGLTSDAASASQVDVRNEIYGKGPTSE